MRKIANLLEFDQALQEMTTLAKVYNHAALKSQSKMRDLVLAELAKVPLSLDEITRKGFAEMQYDLLASFQHHKLIDNHDFRVTDYDLEMEFDGTISQLVAVKAVGADTQTKETFHVQLTEGLHRPDLGCVIFSSSGKSGGVSELDYPLFNLDAISDFAEEHAREEMSIETYKGYYLIDLGHHIGLATDNPRFRNRDSSPYEKRFNEYINLFDSRSEAKEYVDDLR